MLKHIQAIVILKGLKGLWVCIQCHKTSTSFFSSWKLLKSKEENEKRQTSLLTKPRNSKNLKL